MILKELRIKHNISQAEMAKILNVSQKSISNYENGLSDPNIETLKKIADFFRITIDSLVGHEVPYLLDKSTLTAEQKVLVGEVTTLNREQCNNVSAYIKGLLQK